MKRLRINISLHYKKDNKKGNFAFADVCCELEDALKNSLKHQNNLNNHSTTRHPTTK